jgi:hypothetical protein
MANDVRRDPARQLAVLLDQQLANAWSAKPQVAALRHNHEGTDEIEIVELDEPAASTLNDLPCGQPGVVAVGITALGHATPSSGSTVPYRVRVTVAATCCHVVAIVRSAESCQESRHVEGEIVADLRAWARLDRCACRAA